MNAEDTAPRLRAPRARRTKPINVMNKKTLDPFELDEYMNNIELDDEEFEG